MFFSIQGQAGAPGEQGIQGEAGGAIYTDNSNVSSALKTPAEYIRDNAWHDLDLSGVVPSGAVLVHLKLEQGVDTIGDWSQWQNNASANVGGCMTSNTISTTINSIEFFFLGLDVNRKIKYRIKNANVDPYLYIIGWIVQP